jgi:hypothetical protein
MNIMDRDAELASTHKGVKFRWVRSRGERGVPIMAIVSRELVAQFEFMNMTNKPIQSLTINVMATPPGEYDICRCSDMFQREVYSEPKLGNLFRTTSKCVRIIYNGQTIDSYARLDGWLSVRFNKLEGESRRAPGFPYDYVPVTLSLRADYRFQEEISLHSMKLKAEEMAFLQRGPLPERIIRKLWEEWPEYLAVAVFSWIVALLSHQSLSRALRALIDRVTSLLR